MMISNTINCTKNFIFRKQLLLGLFIFITFFSWGQTVIYNLAGGGSLPSGWAATNNVNNQPIDKLSYYLVEAGNPSDIITSKTYDLSAYSSAELKVDIKSYGSGSHNKLKIEVSTDGGNTFTQSYLTNLTTTSYVTQTISLSSISNSVVVKYSNNGSSGRGIRMQNIKLIAISAGPTITNISQTPTTVTSSDTVSVSADVTDPDGVSGVDLHWGTSSGSLTNTISMSAPSGSNTYTTTSGIPTQADGTTVYYEIYALDNNADDTTSSEQSYTVDDTPPCATELIISEYIEGSSNNKYLEIYNDTGASVNMGDYDIRIYTNGSNSVSTTINLDNVNLAGGDVFVIANSSANIWSGTPDQTSGSLNYNGDDAIELYNTSTNQSVDIIGQIGNDPGSQWGSGSTTTKDHTLVRKAGVVSGDTNGSDAFDPAVEWDGYTLNETSYLGSHTMNCSSSPEIEIQGNGVEIVNGDTTPSDSDDTDFGQVEVAGTNSVSHTFTINNTGGADLTINSISSDNNMEFAISGTTSGTIAAGSSTTFTVTFDPSALGTRSATITVDNDDADEGTYTFKVQGTGTNSAASDIVANTSFTYTSNIDYLSYQATGPFTGPSGSVGVFKFDIRDGGGSADADALGTELTEIVFDVGTTHINYIRSAALFAGNSPKATNPNIDTAAGTITFTGLSGSDFTAPDDSSKSLTLRVSFNTTVTDNEQLQFSISSATANTTGSIFAAQDAGGAFSSTTNDRNRIEVTATALAFDQQPTNTVVNQVMSPPVTVNAVDTNSNIDLDFTGTVNITSTGTLSTVQSESAVSGTATFSNIVHTATGTGLTLTATSSGLSQAVSNTFDIENFVYAQGDFRPTTDTDFSYNDDWEYYDGSAWGAVPDGKAPQNTSTTIGRILINKDVSAGGSASHTYDCDIIVFSGGILTITDDDTPPVAEFLSANNTLEVKSGGVIKIQGDIDLNASTNFILRDGAKMYIDQASINNEHPMWDGVELFEDGSEVEINNWDWTASPQKRSLINVTTTISDNANGYKFGKVYFNPNTDPGSNWTIVGGPINVKVTENDFQINNPYSDYVCVMSNKTAGISATFGGDLVVDDGLFAFGSSYSTDSFDQTIVIKGDVLIGSDDDVYLHKAFNGTPTVATGDGQIKVEGNIEVRQMGTNVLSSDVDTKQILLTGDNSHTLYIDRNCSNMPLIVEGGDSAELINSDLKFAGHSGLEIQSGATFNFGFDGNTALEVQNISGSNNTFIQKGGAYLYITHPQGIWDASSNGNVQDFSASNTTYTQSNSTYHYIGKTNQETGDAFTSGSSSKTIICDLENSTDELTLTATTGTSSLLDIRSGVVVNTEAHHIFGSGDLTIGVNGGLKTSVLSSTSNVPMLSGAYTINGGFIELNAAGDQVLKGSYDYKDLIFSNAGTKTISSAIQNIDGTITVKDAAILNVENKQMGGAGTNLTMTGTSQYITDGISGTGVKPDAQGTYSLGVGTKVIFEGSLSTMQKIRLYRDYYNIDIVGSNVGTEALSTPIRLQSGGTFTVKTGATFKLKNTAGFNGGTETAIDNTNNPTITLETGSSIEYYGDNQSITQPGNGYQNLIISGTGDKTLATTEVVVNEDLTVSSSKLLLEDGKGIKVNANVTNNGTIEVDNQGAFVQTDDTSTIGGSGTFQLNKTSLPLNNFWEYVYWSSPINSPQNPSGFTLGDIVSNAWRYYKFDPNEANNGHTYPGWVMLSAADNPEPGAGYAISAPTNASANTILNVSFTKGSDPFNNGQITASILKKGGPDNVGDYNLIGNPYPSAIDFDALYNDNSSVINGTYYLWTNCAGLDANGHHQDSGYTTYVVSGTATAACNGTANQGGTASQYIATAQGFMVEAAADIQTLTFKNAHRVTGHNDNFLNRPGSVSNRDIVWLDMTNDAGKFSQAAVGFYPGATAGYDAMFDAHSLNTGSGFSLYSLAGNDKLVIQGLSLANIDQTLVPLGVEVSDAGDIALQINRMERFDDYDIYLIDNVTGIYHNLKLSPYRIHLDAGVYEDRFVLAFARVLDVEEQAASFSLLLSQQNGFFRLWHPGGENLQKVYIYNLSGQLIFKKDAINRPDVEIDLRNIANGSLLFFKVTDTNGRTAVKKAVKR